MLNLLKNQKTHKTCIVHLYIFIHHFYFKGKDIMCLISKLYMNLFRFTCCCMILFGSCRHSKFPGYNKLDECLFMQLLTIGDGNIPGKGDYVKFEYSIAMDDFTKEELLKTMTVYKNMDSIKNPMLRKILSNLAEGDSAHFIICKNEDCHNTETLRIKLKGVYNTYTELLYATKKDRWRKDMEMNEQAKLKAYIQSKGISDYNIKHGIYYHELIRGHGGHVAKGSQILISYKGYFLNGEVFDSSLTRNHPFDFRFGDPDQVIDGIAIGLSYMKEGGKSKLIIPSQFAFGEQGSSTGIVPPYTTVIYEIELLTIN